MKHSFPGGGRSATSWPDHELLPVEQGRGIEQPTLGDLEGGGHGALEDRVLAKGRDHQAGPHRGQCAQLPFDRGEQQVGVAADAAAQDDQLQVDHRHDHGEAGGEAPRLVTDHPPGHRVAPAGQGEDLLRAERP
jgi:hypothetical protein